MKRPWKKKALLDFWEIHNNGILVVSRKEDWRLHAMFTKEEIEEFVEYIKGRVP